MILLKISKIKKIINKIIYICFKTDDQMKMVVSWHLYFCTILIPALIAGAVENNSRENRSPDDGKLWCVVENELMQFKVNKI